MNSLKNNEPEIILPTELHPELDLILIHALGNCCYGRMRPEFKTHAGCAWSPWVWRESRIVIEKRSVVWFSVLGLNSESSAYE